MTTSVRETDITSLMNACFPSTTNAQFQLFIYWWQPRCLIPSPNRELWLRVQRRGAAFFLQFQPWTGSAKTRLRLVTTAYAAAFIRSTPPRLRLDAPDEAARSEIFSKLPLIRCTRSRGVKAKVCSLHTALCYPIAWLEYSLAINMAIGFGKGTSDLRP